MRELFHFVFIYSKDTTNSGFKINFDFSLITNKILSPPPFIRNSENRNHCSSANEKEQPSLRQFNSESQGQLKLVLYFDQFSTDIEKLPRESPLAGDTTFNIGEYLFT